MADSLAMITYKLIRNKVNHRDKLSIPRLLGIPLHSTILIESKATRNVLKFLRHIRDYSNNISCEMDLLPEQIKN